MGEQVTQVTLPDPLQTATEEEIAAVQSAYDHLRRRGRNWPNRRLDQSAVDHAVGLLRPWR